MLMRKTNGHSGLSKGEKRTAFKMVLLDMTMLMVAVGVVWFCWLIIF